MRLVLNLQRFLIVKRMSSNAVVGPVESAVKYKLTTAFSPSVLQIINESHRHNVPDGSESHFKVVIVSEEFEGKTPIQRHRLVNNVLAEDLAKNIHALSIQAKTPSQWQSDNTVVGTPNCGGGDGSLPPRNSKPAATATTTIL